MREFDVTRVKAVGPARLEVQFADGLAGEVEFREAFFFGVFEAIRDPTLFSQARCDQGFVEWPGNLDLAPDSMHDAIQKHGRWVLE